MNEPTEFKYPLDEYGEPYFAGSHVDAIEGMQDIKDRLNKAETNINNNSSINNNDIQKINGRLDKAEENIKTNSEKQINLENALEGYIGVTDWVSYASNVASGVEVDVMYTNYNGLKCALKEVRIGIDGVTPVVRYKTISYNLRGFKLGEQVAQLPTGFVKNAQLFPAFGSGSMSSYRIEIMPNGKMTILGGTNDKTLSPSSYWVYGQHTWIE
ncbi:hypothetical protein [Mammaliicoccus sciuri]|uniref:hypothetical protein n=1 Tax=Mammaliicoccus sciuri TaxID=1296 RepID=UPI001FB30535|nr:hypothetical protein [Mammaliicoccus sciuri]MCJ1783081.1 hypothetical protein [Mammaliicoccus sciuri]